MRSIFVLEVDEGSGAIFADQRDMATHSVAAMDGIQDQGEGMIIADVRFPLLLHCGAEGTGSLEPPHFPAQG